MSDSPAPAVPPDPAAAPPAVPAGHEPTMVMPHEGTHQAAHEPAHEPPASGSLGNNPLPVGHVLQEYVIEGLIGEGGFGIVYLARDTQLGRVVALKEYMPSSLAMRGQNAQVSVRSERERVTFDLGRRSFVNEAQLLASFDQPSLVKVYRFWEQNGTAYMVMPFYEGPTFKQWLLEHGSPSETWLLAMLAPLLDALEVMHHSRCYHRDIAPDNILLLKQQAAPMGAAQGVRPMLLDFGAARRVIGDATQALTVILKPGYAPIEQYAESSSMKQGAWTDVYALCAVLYAAVTGRAPQPSVSRILNDELVPAVVAGQGRYSPAFLACIDAGLSVRPSHRPQSMTEFRTLISAAKMQGEQQVLERAAEIAPVPETGAAIDTSMDKTVVIERPASAAIPPAMVSGPPPPPPLAPTTFRTPPPPPSPVPAAPAASSRRGVVMGGGGLALALVAGGAWWLMSSQPAPVVSPKPVVPAASAPASQAVLGSGPAPVAPPPTVPFTVVGALQDIVRQADPLLSVNVLADKSLLTIGNDRLQFRVKSSESGYLYVFLAGTDKSHFYLLFPNQVDKNNKIVANQEILLPRKSWAITAGGPPGTDHIVTMVSRRPRDFGAAGLQGAGAEIPEFDLARAEHLWAGRAAGVSPFVGTARCEEGAACDGGYGATLLEVEEVAEGRVRGR